jgi:ATP-dependent Lon protease
VIIPRRNEADLEDLPEEVRSAIKFVLVDNINEVLQAALEPASPQKSAVKPRKTSKKKPDGESNESKNHVD